MPVISRFHGIVIKMYLKQKEHKLIKAFVLKYGNELLKMWETQEFFKLEPIE